MAGMKASHEVADLYHQGGNNITRNLLINNDFLVCFMCNYGVFSLKCHADSALLLLAFTGSVGMTFLIIACAIHDSWWPTVVVLFYILAPLPTLIARRQNRIYPQSQGCMDLAIFLTMGIVVSSFALPIIFSRTPSKVIETDACYLTIIGNIVIYTTYVGFFVTLFQDDLMNYGMY